MGDECFYEEISSIVARVSGRTLKMKTNNVKLLNKIGFELSSILSKVNDIVKMYQADKNDFINDVELIQRDYIDMSRKIDERFSVQNANYVQSKDSPAKRAASETTVNQTNLQRILDTSNSSIEENESDKDVKKSRNSQGKSSKKKRKEKRSKASPKADVMDTCEVSQHDNSHEEKEKEFGLMIPDTCAFNYTPKKIAPISHKNRNSSEFIIRETVDSNEFLEAVSEGQETVVEPSSFENNIENTSDLDKTLDQPRELVQQISQTKSKKLAAKKIGSQNSNSQSSTPMAVKKKLQEYGLLDMTNSPEKMSQLSIHESPFKSKKGLLQKPSEFSTTEDISSPSVVQKPKASAADKLLTPVKYKLMLDKTPNKSPSLIFKTTTNQQTAVNISTFNMSKSSKTKSSNKKNPGTDKTFDCQFDLLNEIPSPMKKSAQNSNSSCSKDSSKTTKKRMKQLTMSQAFAVQKTTPTSKPTAEAPHGVDLEETCLPEPVDFATKSIFDNPINKPNFTSVYKTKEIKSEPQDCDKPAETTTTLTTMSLNVNNMKLKKIKPEPMVAEEDTTSPIVNSLPKPATNEETCLDLENDETNYFNDFDKVPKKKDEGPAYKHVQVVRKHDERKKLGTMACKECENYWNSLPEDKRPQRMDDLCRHRAKFQAPDTPEHYWSIAFPNTQDCIDRGYGGILVESDKADAASKRPRRKRPLKLQTAAENKKKRDDSADFDFGFDEENS